MKLFDGNKYRTESFCAKLESGTMTEPEKRKLEMEMLKPEKLPHYTGKLPGIEAATPVQSRTVKVVLRTDEEFHQVKEHFGLRNYVEQNIKDVDKLVALLNALDDRTIIYDAETKTIRSTRSRIRGH